MTNVCDFTAGHMLRGLHLERDSALAERCFLCDLLGACLDAASLLVACREDNQSLIADLAAHRAVERCLAGDNGASLSIGECFRDGILVTGVRIGKRRHGDDAALRLQAVIADKRGIHRRIHIFVYGGCGAHIGCCLT